MPKTMQNTAGTARYGWIQGNKATPEIRAHIRDIRTELSTAFDRDDAYDLFNVSATRLDGKLHFLLETVGPEVYPRHDVVSPANETLSDIIPLIILNPRIFLKIQLVT